MAKDTIFKELRNEAKGRELSVQWYRSKIRALAPRISARRMLEQGKTTVKPNYGLMNLFWYKPIHAAKLSYYDVFPLVLPLDPISGGFIGMNFHYLPPLLRFEMLDKMSRFATDRKFDKKTIFDLNYDDVKRIKIIKPTLKKYLWSHMRSDFLRVDLDEAAIAIMLPVARFKKASEAVVWSDSRNKIA